MTRTLVTACACAMFGLAGCTSDNAGYYPAPVRLPKIVKVLSPAVPLAHGESVVFSVSWRDGRDPFLVTWDFGGGTTPLQVVSGATEHAHSVAVTMCNETVAPISYTGLVKVVDDAGRESRENFNYIVQPVPVTD